MKLAVSQMIIQQKFFIDLHTKVNILLIYLSKL